MMSEYKPNSYKSKELAKEKLPEKKVEKVVTGTAVVKKKTEMSKLKDVFISEDAKNVKSYILIDVLIPAAKKAISDIITNGIDMILYGETNHSRKNTIAGGISYRSFYDKKDEPHKYGDTRYARTTYTNDEVVIPSRGEAEEVLERMEELISTYGMATVADFYDLVGITCEYTDHKYGWTNIRNADIRRARDGGWIIKLPKAMVID